MPSDQKRIKISYFAADVAIKLFEHLCFDKLVVGGVGWQNREERKLGKLKDAKMLALLSE